MRVAPVHFKIVPYDLNVDGSGQAKIENLGNHVGRQESERNPRELLRKCQTKLMNVVVRGMVLGGKGHKNIRIRRSNRCGIAVGEIDATVGQANIVNDVLEFACRYLPSNRLLDLIAKVGRFFNAHSGGSTQMKLESAAVNAGEEVPAQPRNQNYQRAETTREKHNQENTPVMETKSQQAAIAATKSLEGLLKALLKSYQRIADCGISLLFFFSSQ